MKLFQKIAYKAKLKDILSNGEYSHLLKDIREIILAGLFLTMLADIGVAMAIYGATLEQARMTITYVSTIIMTVACLIIAAQLIFDYPAYRYVLNQNLKAYGLKDFWRHQDQLHDLANALVRDRKSELEPVERQLAQLDDRYAEAIRQYSNYQDAREGLAASQERLNDELNFYNRILTLTANYRDTQH